MAINYPTSKDDSTTLPNPSASDDRNSPSLAGLNDNQNSAVIALESKLGITASTPASGMLLRSTADGESTWDLAYPGSTIVGISDTQTLTNKTLTSPTINGATISNPTLDVDAVVGYTTADSGTVYGISVASSKISGSVLTDASISHAALSTGSSWAWQSWTPTWVNLTVGNGTNGSRYTQIGKTVIAELKFTLGSTSSVGGSVTFTLPVSERSTYNTLYEMLGSGSLYHVASSAPWLAQAGWSSSGVGILYTWSISTFPAGRLLSASIPFTWASTDQIRVLLTYEAA